VVEPVETDNGTVSFHRYVALGDSFTEGVGDPDPTRPNGLRGWADRVAEALARQSDDFGYANLAIRGRKLPAILDEQLEPALALRPDLVTIYAGANDILRPKVDIDALAERYDVALTRLADTGARLVVFTAFDPGGSAIYRPLRGRFALYNEFVRDSARRLGADVVDFWRLREYRDWRYWDADRMHMGPAGHQHMAMQVLDALGVPHGLEELPPTPHPELTAKEVRAQNLQWARTHAVPWVHRRLTGRSSGDTISPKRPSLAPIEPASRVG
jgi:lysophospholipase L1-like esterase